MQQDTQNPTRSPVAPEEVYAELDLLIPSPIFNHTI